MGLRTPAEWMVRADDRLLEYLAYVDSSTPTQIVEDGRIDFSRTHANTRLKRLAQAGLVENIGNGVYRITETGQQYLSGEIGGQDLPEPEME